MTDRTTRKTYGRPAKAMFLAACMVLCAVVPMVTSMDDDSSVYADDVPLNYVSLGDSMVSGFGFDGYYTEEGLGGMLQILGDEEGETATYPYLISEWLTEQGFDVDLKQLAISGMRTTDLRLLIDDGFSGEEFSIGGNPFAAIGAEKGDFDALSDYYKAALTNADLITYQFHYDLSLPFAQSFYGLIGVDMGYEYDLAPYVGQDVLDNFAAIYEMLYNEIYGFLVDSGLDADAFASVIDTVGDFIQPIVYAVISYCSNFDANMEAILGMNPDATTVVLENNSSISKMDAVVTEIAGFDVVLEIDVFLDMIFNIVNLYTGYLSPYSGMVHQIDAGSMSMGEEFMNGIAVTDDAKNCFMAELGVPPVFNMDINPEIPTDGHVLFDQIDENGNLSTFISKVFNSATFRLADFAQGGASFDEFEVSAESKLVTLIGDYSSGFEDGFGYLARDDVQFQDLVGGGLQITCGAGTVVLDSAEMIIIWINYYLAKLSHVMGHFSPYTHIAVSDYVTELLADEGLLDNIAAEPLGAPMAFGSQAPAADGTLLSLVVDTGSAMTGVSYPNAVAEALGLDLHQLSTTSPLRAADIAYLIGATEVKDDYTDMVLAAIQADTGMTVDEIRSAYQEAIGDSDAVLLNISTFDSSYCMIQIMSILTGNDAQDVSPYKFGLLPAEVSERIQVIMDQMESFLTQLTAQQPELLEAVEDVTAIAENVAATVLSYALSYDGIIATINEINPDVEIIVAGSYNLLDGFVYEVEGYGYTVGFDVGSIGLFLTQLSNSYYERQFSDYENVTLIDLSNAHKADTTVNIADMEDITEFLLTMFNASLDEDEIGTIVAGALGAVAGNTYTATFEYEDGSTIPLEFLFGEAIVGPELPTKVGYIASWDAPETMPASDVHVTLSWAPITYTIVYDANGGVGADVVMTYTYDVAAKVASDLFDRNGYVFVGWNTIADGSGTMFDVGEEFVNILDTDGASITLYAQWEESDVHGTISSTALTASVIIIIAVLAIGALFYYRRN